MADDTKFAVRREAIQKSCDKWAGVLRASRLVLFLLYTAGVVILWTRAIRAQDTGNLPQDAAQLRLLVDSYRSELTRMQQLLGLLAGLGTLFALVQGGFSYLSVEVFTKRAKELFELHKEDLNDTRDDLNERQKKLDDTVAKIEKDAEEEITAFIKRVAEQHPLLDEFASGLARMSSDIARITRRVGLDRTRFSKLEASERRTIAYYEPAMPFLEHVGSRSRFDAVWTLLQFSVYHYSRMLWSKKQLELAKGDAVEESHLRREITRDERLSEYYMQRAEDLDAHDHRVLAEKGYRFMMAKSHQKSRELFTQSLSIRPEQRCSLYCLAWIEDEENNLPAAKDLLERALKIDHWLFAGDGLTARCSSVPYNLACCLARLASQAAAKDVKSDLLQKSFVALKDAMLFPKEREGSLKTDVERGELQIVAEGPVYKDQVASFLTAVYG